MKKLFVLTIVLIVLSQLAFAGTNYISSLLNNNFTIGNSNIFFMDSTNNRIGIGMTSPQVEFQVKGSKGIILTPANPVLAGNHSNSQYVNWGSDVYVSGKYAYVVSDGSSGGVHALVVYDVSNPSAPKFISNISDIGNNNFSGAQQLFVLGRYAYAIAYSSKSLDIFDVSNPSSISYIGNYTSSTILNGPLGLYVSGNHAYISTDDGNSLVVLDISIPTGPVLSGIYTNATRMAGPRGVYVSGKYAYVASAYNDSLVIIDISNPLSPKFVGNYTDSVNLDWPVAVAVSGRYAYVSGSSAKLNIIDVSNPSAPSIVSTYTVPSLSSISDIKLSGKYAYLTSSSDDAFYIVDVSNASSPRSVGNYTSFSILDLSQSSFISGKYAYIAVRYGLTILELPGLDSPTASIGDIATEHLSVTDNAVVHNNLYVDNGLGVGPGSIFVNGNTSFSGDIVSNKGSSLYLADQPNTDGTTTYGLRFHYVDSGAYIDFHTDTSGEGLNFRTGGLSESGVARTAMFIFSNSSRVDIGGTGYAPLATLNVSGTLHVQPIPVTDDYGTATRYCRATSGVIGGCSSSIRYKYNVTDLGVGLEKVEKLRPVSFNWKKDNASDIGFIAEEVHDVEPFLTEVNESGDVQGVNYFRFIPVLANALKQQIIQLEDVKRENDGLKQLFCLDYPQEVLCR